MKTIFIPIFSGHTARNFFRTDIYTFLTQKEDLRLIIFVSPFKKDFYQKEFGKENVIFEPLKTSFKISFLERLIGKVSLYLVDTNTMYLRHKVDYSKDSNFPKYAFKFLFTKIFSQFYFVKKMVRYLDYRFCQNPIFAEFFKKYNPDLVFSLHLQKPIDIFLLKEAKKRKVFSIGLVNSWDNITARGLMRILPDKMIVHNEIIKKEAIVFTGMKEEDIFISGLPHFDFYLDYKPDSKEKFCEKLGLDFNKIFILFSPPSLSLNVNWWEKVKYLSHAIDQGILSNMQILIRYMPIDNEADIKSFPDDKNVFHDRTGIEGSVFGGKKTDWEWSGNDMNHLADSLYFCSVLVNYGSTLTIDAAAFDKPIINMTIPDNWLNLERSHHFQHIVKTGGTRLAVSKEELLELVKDYLKDPSLDGKGRKRIIEEQCWKFDGKAGQRMTAFVLAFLDNY